MTGLSYDADFLHIARLQQKQKIDTVILSGLLTALFLTQFSMGPGQPVSSEEDILPNYMGDFQKFSGDVTKYFLLAADFHCHKL